VGDAASVAVTMAAYRLAFCRNSFINDESLLIAAISDSIFARRGRGSTSRA